MIRILDVFHHVSAAVQADGPQHPVMKRNDLQDNFAISRSPRARGKHGAVSSRAATIDETWWTNLERSAVALYPLGPHENAIWSRAGGDTSVLTLGLTGVAAWHLAVRLIKKGGGGLASNDLISAMHHDSPNNAELARLREEAN